MKYSYQHPKETSEDYSLVIIDTFCKRKCFEGYGGCPSTVEKRVINIPRLIERIKDILNKDPKAKILLDAPNFIDTPYDMNLPDESENQHIKLLKAIIKAGINGYFRVEMTPVSFIGQEGNFIQFLRNAGIREVWIGVESADEKLRDKYGKPEFNNTDVKKITRDLQKEGVLCCWYLVAGFEDTDNTIQTTVNLVKEVSPDRIFITDLIPYLPGEGRIDLTVLKKDIEKIEQFQKILWDLADKMKKKRQ